MKLKVSLFKKGDIDKAIQAVEKYRQSLNDKGAIFVQRLAEIGIPIIDARIARAQGDSDPEHYTYIRLHSFGDYSEADLVVEGKDILFIEFGAGVHFNGAAGSSKRIETDYKSEVLDYHISGGKELGYTIGSYGKGHGKEDRWFYRAENGDVIMSHGTEGTMPMYHATMEIINNIERIAREVYGGQ